MTTYKKKITQSVISENEANTVLVEWNATNAPWPQKKCIHHLFEIQAETTPEATALIYKDNHISYRDLFGNVKKLASTLVFFKVDANIPVTLFLDRSVETVIAIYSVLRAGGYYVPFDTEWPEDRIQNILNDVNPPVLLTTKKYKHKIPKWYTGALIFMDALPQPPKTELRPKNSPTPSSPIYCMFTSGSTGNPKGIVVKHCGLVKRIQWFQDQYQLTNADRILNKTPYGFGVSEWEYFWALTNGATLVIGTPQGHKDPDYIYSQLIKEKITISFFVPSMLAALLKYMKSREMNHSTSLTHLFTCGEVLLPFVCSEFYRRFDARLINLYGPSEADMTYWECPRPGSDEQIEKVLIGKPISNTWVYLLDENMNPVPIGASGELYFGGPTSAKGYLNLPELTSKKFISNPFANGLLYKTGDLAKWQPDGNLEFLGRIDHQVKIRGYRIELGEIEIALNQHPLVQETVAFVREDKIGDQRLVAYFVSETQQSITSGKLRSFLEQKLPEYMIPSAFVELDAIPLTSNGKIDYNALVLPDTHRPELENTFVAPRTSMEMQLAAIWSNILGLEQVGIYDNFFHLGGHSLLATQFIAHLVDQCQIELSLSQFFATPTIAQLAQHLKTARSLSPKPHALTPVTSRKEPLPLSFGQYSLWFIDQLKPGQYIHNLPIAYHLLGSLNLNALERSINEIVRRHEILRTTFPVMDGQPIQFIAPTLKLQLLMVNLEELSINQRKSEALRLMIQESQHPFDLTQGPLLQTSLFCLAPEDHILFFNIHHIISDGWSFKVFEHEMTTLYEDYSTGRPPSLPELPIQYADFTFWQKNRLQNEYLEKHLTYWKQQLSGTLPVLELPTDRPRLLVKNFQGAKQIFTLPKPLLEELKSLSQQENATLFMTLLTAFNILLYRYTDQEDILIGSPIANRTRPEFEQMIGFFINVLVLRTDMSGNPTFRTLLSQVRKVALEAYAHPNLFLEKLLEELRPDREMSPNPLFQVMFVLQNMPGSTIKLSNLVMKTQEIDNQTSQFDLTLYMTEQEGELVGNFEYNTNLFNQATIIRMIGHFETLLKAIIIQPDTLISTLPLLTEVEQHQLLFKWNKTQIDYQKDKSLIQRLEEQVKQTPTAIAFIAQEQQLTYQELNWQANRLAHYLQTLGVERGVKVGLSIERSLDAVVALLGIFKVGGVYVPLDPAYPQERLALIIKDVQISVLLTQTKFAEKLPSDQGKVICLDVQSQSIAQYPQSNLSHNISPEALAYIIYTSGSTGRPKGVAVPHKQILNRLAWMWRTYPFDAEETSCQKTALNFVDSIWEIFGALLQGSPTVIVPNQVLTDPAELVNVLAKYKVTRLWLVPSLLKVILDIVPDLKSKLPRLKFWVTSGEAISVELWQRFQAEMPQSILYNLYGTSEVWDVTWYEPEPQRELFRVPIGRPIDNMQTYILDQCLNPVPIGVPGELYIGGEGLAQGYLNQSQLTAESFIQNPFYQEAGTRLYRTGDLTRYLPDGQIEFIGRTDHQAKIRGYRIELAEIEAVLNQHQAVKNSVVNVREDVPGDKRLAVHIILNQKQSSSVIQLRDYLREKLPDYMIPSAFVFLDAFPLTPSGKLNRLALPAPESVRPDLETAFIPPQTQTELELVRLWSEMLDIHQIGINDNFFHLGGHSLLAVRLLNRIEQQFNKEFSLASLYQGATIAQQAAIIQAKSSSVIQSSIIPIQTHGKDLPLFFLHNHGKDVFFPRKLVDHLNGSHPVYCFQAIREDGSLQINQSIETMAERYVEDLIKYHPTGPYCLFGYSFGGILAYEMARQLHLKNKKVAMLGIFDTSQNSNRPRTTIEKLQYISRVMGNSPYWLYDVLLHRDRKEFAARIRAKFRNCKRMIKNKFSHDQGLSVQNRLEDIFALGFNQLSSDNQALMEMHYRASTKYEPKPYPGKMTLFRCKTRPPFHSLKRDLGWSKLAIGGLDIKPISGNHVSILTEPNVIAFARTLEDCLVQLGLDTKSAEQEN